MSRPEQQDGGQDEVRSTPPVSDAEIEADLGRDSTGGQPGAGHADQSHNATDDKELHALLGLDTDDLDRVPVLEPGTKLQQGGTYVDLNDPERRPFKAMGGHEAGPDNRYVPKRDTDHEMWNVRRASRRPEVEAPTAAAADEVVLRPVEDEDLPILFEHQADPEASRMAAFPSRERDAFMTHWDRIRSDPTTITRTVLVAGRVAGNIVCWEHPDGREVGYWIGREHWGCGVATRALRAFLTEVRVRPLVAHVAWHNGASIRVLEKCGFRRAPTAVPGRPEDDVMIGFELV